MDSPDTRPRCYGVLGKPLLVCTHSRLLSHTDPSCWCKGCPDCAPDTHSGPTVEEATALPLDGEIWFPDSYCSKHDGYHLQNADGGTEITFRYYADAVRACEALNSQAVALQEARDELERLGTRERVLVATLHEFMSIYADFNRMLDERMDDESIVATLDGRMDAGAALAEVALS